MESGIKIAICEDDEFFLHHVGDLVRSHSKAEQFDIHLFTDGKYLLDEDLCSYDLFFMDIEMKETLGVDVAVEIRRVNAQAVIFFISSYTSYVSDAFRTGAFQYLYKPLKEEYFKQEFDRALETVLKRKSTLKLVWNGVKDYVKIGNIVYIENHNRKISVYLADGAEHIAKAGIAELACNLKLYDFVRCHYSYIVNLNMVHKIDGYKLIMMNRSVVPISKNYLKDVRERYRLFITGEDL